MVELGKVLVVQRQTEDAFQWLRTAVGRQPGNTEARLALAVLYRNEGALGRAMDEAKEVLKRKPRSVEALYELGAAQALAQQHKDAEETLRRALAIAPDNTLVLVGLARLLYQGGRLDEAESLVRRAQKLEPSNTDALVLLAQVLSRKEPLAANREEALTLLDRARQLAPARPDLPWFAGEIYVAQGRWRQALSALLAAIRQDPDRTQAYFLLARTYRELGDLPESRRAEAEFHRREAFDRKSEDLRNKIAANPENAQLRFELADLHASIGHEDRAITWYRRGLERDPKNARARKRLSELLRRAVER
jgi:tetratricopeptide (TPR) repeat protein